MALECLDVTLSRINYHKTNPNNPAGVPFLIGRTTAGKSIKGSMRKAVEGEQYRLWGEWKPQKGDFPPAFEFVHHEPVIQQTTTGIAHYLSTFVDGLGQVKSAALVNEFGTDTLKVLRETPEQAETVKGITPEIVESIRNHFAENVTIDPVAYSLLADMFKDHKFPKRLIQTLLKHWGSDAPAKLKEAPYVLLSYPRMGWKGVDAFATSEAIGYPREGMDRHKYAIVEAVSRVLDEGHTVANRVEVEISTFKLLGSLPAEEAWQVALDEVLIVQVGEDLYSLPEIAWAEQEIVRRLTMLARSAVPLPFEIPTTNLLPGQQEAVRLIQQHGVVIVAGAPGTGKSYTLAQVVAGLVAQGVKGIRFVAPTGKAAKRSAELIEAALPASGIPSTTIHKALGPIPNDEPEGVPSVDSKIGRGRAAFTFSRNAENPIEARVIVVEEASMLDVSLAADLFGAIAPGTLVIIVGDPNQLPSVGSGSVLRDLIEAGIPTATLTEVQRNCGTVVQACHDILAGKTPTPAKKLDLDAKQNWIHIEIDDPAAINERIVNLHKTAKRFDPVWEMQVISPEKDKAGVGCKALNKALSEVLNTWRHIHPTEIPEADRFGNTPPFLCGDKVTRTKNGFCDQLIRIDEDSDERPDWVWGHDRFLLKEIDIVNGDMGEIVDICASNGNTYIVVDFVNPHRRCRLPYANSHLIPAYAMTTHKCQGSGFPYVVLPVHNSFFFDSKTGVGLWNKEMFYTMLSRIEQLGITVGQWSAIEAAVRRPTIGRRRTRLAELIKATQREEAACLT